jgi:hypothetical protein
MSVTIDGVWIYWTLTECNYKWLRHSHWVTRSKNYCNHRTHKVFPVFLNRCSVEASNGRRSPSSGFPNCPQTQLPDSHSNRSQRPNLSSSLTLSPNNSFHSTDWLTDWLSNCPAYNMSARTTQKTQFVIFVVIVGTCLFAKSWLKNSCCIFASLFVPDPTKCHLFLQSFITVPLFHQCS